MEAQQRVVRAAARDAFLRFAERGLITGAAVLEYVEGSTYAESCHQHEFEAAWAEADGHRRGALDETEFQSFLLAVDRFAAAAADNADADGAPAPDSAVTVPAPVPPAAPPVAAPSPPPPASPASPASIRPDNHWIAKGEPAAAPAPPATPAALMKAPPSPSPQSKLAAFLAAVPASPTVTHRSPARSASKLAAFVAATPNPASPTPSRAFATPPEPRLAAPPPPPPPTSPSRLAAFVAAVPNPASPVYSWKEAASPARPARHRPEPTTPAFSTQPFVSALPSPATLVVTEIAHVPDAAPPEAPIEERTWPIAATRTMATAATQTPVPAQKPVANPTRSAAKQRPAPRPAPPADELEALDDAVRACVEIRTSLRVLTDPMNFAGAPVTTAEPLPAFSEPSPRLDAQKAPTRRSAKSAQRHVDRVREGLAQKAAAKTPGATRERAMAATRSFASTKRAQAPRSPERLITRRTVKRVATRPARFRRPPLAVQVSATRDLPALRKAVLRGAQRHQYRVAGRVAWAEGGEAHFRTKVRYDSLDFGDQRCLVEVPRKVDPAKAVVQFFVLYGSSDEVLAAGGAHMADLSESRWLPLKRGSAAADGRSRGALKVRAYVASPSDLAQLNAPPRPPSDVSKWSAATPALLRRRYEGGLRSAASPLDVAEDLRRYHATLVTAQRRGESPPPNVEATTAPSVSSYFAGADASPASTTSRNGADSGRSRDGCGGPYWAEPQRSPASAASTRTDASSARSPPE